MRVVVQVLRVVTAKTRALEYLQGIYNDARQSTSVRMRAAIECLPFENPKLSATAVSHMDERSFAAALERAIERRKIAFASSNR